MKVAIDSGPLSGGHAVRGIGFYTRFLIDSLEKLGTEDCFDGISFGGGELSKYDLLHYPFFDLFFRTLSLKKGKKMVVTIHDVIPLLYPNSYPPGVIGKINYNFQKLLLNRVDAVITDSETSKKDIVRFLGVPQDKVNVIYLAPNPNIRKVTNGAIIKAVKKKYKLPQKFILYVGDVNFNKNLSTLVKASAVNRTPLVIVGKSAKQLLDNVGNYNHPETIHLNELGRLFSKHNVICLGFVPDDELSVIYSIADVYCQPSCYEGFGLPPLEALVCGCPVVAARTQSLVEILGNNVLYADPQKPEDFAKKFKIVQKNVKPLLKYSWSKTAKDTHEVYKKVLTQSK